MFIHQISIELMFLYLELLYLGIFIMLKRKIKCIGHQQTEFGKVNLFAPQALLINRILFTVFQSCTVAHKMAG